MDIETTPRIDFLTYHLDLHKGWVERFTERLKNIEDNPEPPASVNLVAFYHEGRAVDSAVRMKYPEGDLEWLLTGYEEPQTWEAVVDNVASATDYYTIDVRYVVDLDSLVDKSARVE